MQTKLISQRDKAISEIATLTNNLDALTENIENALMGENQSQFDKNLAELCVMMITLTKDLNIIQENDKRTRKKNEKIKQEERIKYQSQQLGRGKFLRLEEIKVLTVEDFIDKFNYGDLKAFIQKNNNNANGQEVLNEFIKKGIDQICQNYNTDISSLDSKISTPELIHNIMDEYFIRTFRSEHYEPKKMYAETIMNILKNQPLQENIVWSAGITLLLLQQERYRDILSCCASLNKNKHNTNLKKQILATFIGDDLETRIVKYKILQIWSMNKEADELFQKITADNPGYIAKDLLRDYLKGKRDPDSFSLEELEKIQEAFALPYIQVLLSFEPEVFQEKAEKLFAVLEAERNFAESDGTDFHKQLAQGFLETNRALEFFSLEELQQIKNVLLRPQLAILSKYASEILQEKIKEIDAVLETERNFQEAGSIERAIFREVDSVKLPERPYFDLNNSIYRNVAYENNQSDIIHVAQLNSENPLVKFIRKIQTKYDDKDTIIVEFFCGLRTIRAMLDLRSMEMVIVNASEVGFSSKDVEREITNLLCDLLPELANKKTYPELNLDDSEKTLHKIFKNNGQSVYTRDLTWRKYIAGEFSNLIIEGITDDELKTYNPFREEYFLLISEENKVATVKPLVGIKTLDKLDSLKNVIVVRYFDSHLRHLRQQNPGKDAVDRYIADFLSVRNLPKDETAIQQYKDDVILEITKDENLRLKDNGEFVLTKAIRVKDNAGDLISEYLHEDMTFVHGHVRWLRVDASAVLSSRIYF